MQNLTRQQFEELVKHGTIRKPTGQSPAGEDLCQTALEFGIINGYSLADICHFYAHMQRTMGPLRDAEPQEAKILDAAYDKFVQDIVAFAGTVIDAATGIQRRAVSNTVPPLLISLLRPLVRLSSFFLSSKR